MSLDEYTSPTCFFIWICFCTHPLLPHVHRFLLCVWNRCNLMPSSAKGLNQMIIMNYICSIVILLYGNLFYQINPKHFRNLTIGANCPSGTHFGARFCSNRSLLLLALFRALNDSSLSCLSLKIWSSIFPSSCMISCTRFGFTNPLFVKKPWNS